MIALVLATLLGTCLGVGEGTCNLTTQCCNPNTIERCSSDPSLGGSSHLCMNSTCGDDLVRASFGSGCCTGHSVVMANITWDAGNSIADAGSNPRCCSAFGQGCGVDVQCCFYWPGSNGFLPNQPWWNDSFEDPCQTPDSGGNNACCSPGFGPCNKDGDCCQNTVTLSGGAGTMLAPYCQSNTALDQSVAHSYGFDGGGRCLPCLQGELQVGLGHTCSECCDWGSLSAGGHCVQGSSTQCCPPLAAGEDCTSPKGTCCYQPGSSCNASHECCFPNGTFDPETGPGNCCSSAPYLDTFHIDAGGFCRNCVAALHSCDNVSGPPCCSGPSACVAHLCQT